MDRSQQLLTGAAEVQRRIDEAFESLTSAELADSKFDQAGLGDGLAIVEDYVRAGELGVACDHLLYMVVEAELALSSASAAVLAEIAAGLGLRRPDVAVVP